MPRSRRLPEPAPEPRTLVTRRYSQVKGLRARGIMSAASAPCELPGCHWRAAMTDYRGRGTGYVYEHCHRHDWIRGVTCGNCNGRMALVDARVDECAEPDWAPYLAWWQRCPECAAGAPWEPWLTRAEYRRLPMLAELADLGRAEPGSRAAADALAAVLGWGAMLADRERLAARPASRAADRAAARRSDARERARSVFMSAHKFG
jgi:transposase